MNKLELIKQLKEIDENYFKGGGAVNRLNKHYPNILKYIDKYSADIQIYHINKKLYAKYLYLTKYDGNINKLTKNNKIMIFDYKSYDFIATANNAAKKQWEKHRNDLLNINELYNKNETIELLKNNYLNYFGKSGNRKLIRDNKKLYLSVYYHTRELDKLDKNLNKFTHRLYILANKIEFFCKKHDRYKFWKLNGETLNINCPECAPKYPSLEWFIDKYGEKNGIKEFKNRSEEFSRLKVNGLEWHINKYGFVDGEKKYRDFVEKRMNNLTKLKSKRYSKILQDLFWNVYNELSNKNDCYFHELNHEFVLRIPKKYNYNKTVMMLDFKQKNKIIEYNGLYWHNEIDDKIRYDILSEMGYDIMIITSDEYNRNKKDLNIIENCINFLK